MLAEFRAAWETLRAAHPSEHFYSFGFYTNDCASYVMVTASTEEGLSMVTDNYVARDGGDPTLTRLCLRWSPCDSPLHGPETELLPRSQELRDSGPDPYDLTVEADEVIALVFDTAVEVLKQLDKEKLFGTDLEREQLVLGIWMGDQSDEDRIAFARQLNPPRVFQRFEKEMAEGYKACRQIP